MQNIDLGSFGFPGTIFRYHGRLVSQRGDGTSLILLFDEAHANPCAIRLAILNACELWRLGVLGCVGVEEYPYYFAEWTEDKIRAASSHELATNGSEDAVIQRVVNDHLPNLPFGKALKLLRPDINQQRDDAFLANLLPWWEDTSPGKAVILNAGKSHQERIVHKLRDQIAYIRIDTAEV